MRVLLDSCVWGGAKEQLHAAGHAVEWIGDRPEDPGDQAIIEEAHHGGKVIITLDKDFGELAVLRQVPHAGIIRLVGIAAMQQGEAATRALRVYEAELRSGAIVTIELTRTRIRPAD